MNNDTEIMETEHTYSCMSNGVCLGNCISRKHDMNFFIESHQYLLSTCLGEFD